MVALAHGAPSRCLIFSLLSVWRTSVARAYPMTNGGNTFDMQDWDACLQGRSNVRKSEGEWESINSIKAVSLNKFYVF